MKPLIRWIKGHWERLLLVPLVLLAGAWVSILQSGWELFVDNATLWGFAIDGIILFVPLIGSVSGVVLLVLRLRKKGDYIIWRFPSE